jgi:hypothetical protein
MNESHVIYNSETQEYESKCFYVMHGASAIRDIILQS